MKTHSPRFAVVRDSTNEWWNVYLKFPSNLSAIVEDVYGESDRRTIDPLLSFFSDSS